MAELPQSRNVELLVSDVDVLSPCCSCREKEGVLKCSGCRAVAYCGQECQEKGWIHHKDVCNKISQLLQQVNAAIEALANEYRGIGALLEALLVKDGHFGFRDRFLSSEDERNFMFYNYYPTKPQEYEIARRKLVNAYARCGKEASSKLAFRLAAENLLHMIRLCRNHKYHSLQMHNWLKYCGWMVAGEMDQQALNLLGYIQRSVGDYAALNVVLSGQEDIEGLSLVSRVKETVLPSYAQRFKVHYFMLISWIKLKRIKALKGEKERWNTFLEGTQSRSGEASVVMMISGMAPVLEKLKEFVVGKATDQRIDSLKNQVNGLLIEVDEDNPKLIPGVLDRHVQMVDNPALPEIDDHKEYFSHFVNAYPDIQDDEKEVHIARFAVRKYGHAMLIDNNCTRALRLFLETGNFMEEEAEEDSTPQTVAVEEVMEGIEKAEEDTSAQTLNQDGGEAKLGESINENAIKADEAMSEDEGSEDLNIQDGKDKTEEPSEEKKQKSKEDSGSIKD